MSSLSTNPMGGKAIFSVEIELAWGFHDINESNKYNIFSKGRKVETESLERLLEMCEVYNIPLTFDIVGHLLLDDCPGGHDGPYPDKWFSEDPGTDNMRSPLFYSPDLINMIKISSINHEIATHTFSHVLGDVHKNSIIEHDIQKASEIHKNVLGEKPSSIVPPRHQQIEEEILVENGIRVARVGVGDPPGSAIDAGKKFLARKLPVCNPTRGKVAKTYTSIMPSMTAPFIQNGQRRPSPITRTIPLNVRKAIHKRYITDGIQRSIDEQKHAHFWTHLSNLSNPVQLGLVEYLFNHVNSKNENGEMDIMRMEEIIY